MMTQKLICDELLRLMGEKPFYRIKVTELVERLGISRTTFYSNYDSIPDVLDKIEEGFLSGLDDAYLASEVIRSVIKSNYTAEYSVDATFEYLKTHLEVFRILAGSNGNPNFKSKFSKRHENVGNILFSSLQMSEAQKKIATAALLGFQWNAYYWWAFHEDEISAGEVRSFMADSIRRFFGNYVDV